ARTPPPKITQEPFEGNDRHLRRLVRLGPGERADAGDLFEYTQDLLYTEIQGPLLVYLLPFCLEAWRDDLRGVDDPILWIRRAFLPCSRQPSYLPGTPDWSTSRGNFRVHAPIHSGRN